MRMLHLPRPLKYVLALLVILATISALLVFDIGERINRVAAQEANPVRACVRAYANVTSWDDPDWNRDPGVLCVR